MTSHSPRRSSPIRMLRLCAFALVVALALSPAAGARPVCSGSPDVCDLNAAARAHQHVHRSGQSPAVTRALAQETYYSSSTTRAPLHRSVATDDSTPWLSLGLVVGSAFAIAGAVAFAVRSRQRLRVHAS